MTIANGRKFLCLPGPTTVPDEVLVAMHHPSTEIYGSELEDVTHSSMKNLARLFGTKNDVYIYISNGHGIWEAALTNVLSRGDKILVVDSFFCAGWGDTASMLGVDVEVLEGERNQACNPDDLEKRLRRDGDGEIKAVLIAHTDTASSTTNDIAATRRAMDAAGHDALLMVDAIASLAVTHFKMDKWGVDVVVGATQKGLMMAPGLSFLAASDKALKAHKTADARTRYWDWTFRQGEEHYHKYGGTPPIQLLFGLQKSLDMIFEEGLDAVIERHRILAGAVHHAVQIWSDGQVLSFNVPELGDRSNSLTTILIGGDYGAQGLLDYCRNKCGVALGIALGDLGGRAIRVSHMGHVNAPMVMGTLGVIETGLCALDIPHGKGALQAAADWMSGEVGA